LDQEFAGVRRWLLSGGVGGLDGMVAALKARFFSGAVSRINPSIIIS
jgi:hypothetical protein